MGHRASPEAQAAAAAAPKSSEGQQHEDLKKPEPESGAQPTVLTGKQEHYLKRELLSRQVHAEITTLNSPTALRRFGAPFRSDEGVGEIAPVDSDLPILRFIFVNHVRKFPFLDSAREREFWQDKLQVFLEAFAAKHISSSEDRYEETKRRKLARKCEKLVELMMVSGLPTASGYEERIRFEEMEVVDRGASELGLLVNVPSGQAINKWDVNVAAVRTTGVRRTVRYHQHAEFLIRVRRHGQPEVYVGRRFGDFVKLHKRLRTELPGKVLPPLPKKNKGSTATSFLGVGFGNGGGNGDNNDYDDDAGSLSSASTQDDGRSARRLAVPTPSHKRSSSRSSQRSLKSLGSSPKPPSSPTPSSTREETSTPTPDSQSQTTVTLYREDQRVSLRAFLRLLLQNPQIAASRAMEDFLTAQPVVTPNEEEMLDIDRRKALDEQRITAQKEFYEFARKRAQELDVYMEQFRQDIVERHGLTKLFHEIKEKETVEELSPQYQKLADWMRIEVAATLYHLFLAEDNSPELFAQAKRIHSLLPYTLMKNVIRLANPAAVMSGVLDIFIAQPFGSRSLLQRIFSMAIHDGIKAFDRSIAGLATKIDDQDLVDKMRAFTESDEAVKEEVRREAADEEVDIVVVILRSDMFGVELREKQVEKVFNSYVAWISAVENIDSGMEQGAQWFAYLKQLLKLLTRQRDKAMMLSIIEEPVTLQLFRDLFTIFYEPLVRVYKSANVYSSITDFAAFADDAIAVVERAQRQDASSDPNQTVQSFIDLCYRHQENFYKFVHEVHVHDNGLFDALMGWIEDILSFLRNGPRSGEKLDMNALFQGAVATGQIDRDTAVAEIDALVKWHADRKKWHHDKTRQKMAAEGGGGGTGTGTGDGESATPETGESLPGSATFRGSDFGLDDADLEDLAISDDASDSADEDSEDEGLDPLAAERKRRAKRRDRLRSNAGEPVKPGTVEVEKLGDAFAGMVRVVLAE